MDPDSPRAIAAWSVFGGLAWERAPWRAAQWLTEGHDGEALRELAGLNGKDPDAVRELLPRALVERGVTPPPTPLAAAIEIFHSMAEEFTDHRGDPAWAHALVQQVVQILLHLRFEDELFDQPLARLYNLDDEWDAGWGRPTADLLAAVEAGCTEQLKLRRSRPQP